jgi:hypothetical protein
MELPKIFQDILPDGRLVTIDRTKRCGKCNSYEVTINKEPPSLKTTEKGLRCKNKKECARIANEEKTKGLDFIVECEDDTPVTVNTVRLHLKDMDVDVPFEDFVKRK